MYTNLSKRFNFFCGLILFLGGCFFLVFITITMQNQLVSIERIVAVLFVIFFVAFLFYTSINSFVKYGIACGIDYSIEQQKDDDTERCQY